MFLYFNTLYVSVKESNEIIYRYVPTQYGNDVKIIRDKHYELCSLQLM